MRSTDRPALFAVGVLLQALHAVFCLFALALVGVFGLGAFGLAALETQGAAWAPLSVVGALGGAFLLAMGAFYVVCLLVCWKSWEGSRTWIWVLVVMTAIGLVGTGPISAVVGVVTLIGAFQALERIPAAAR